MLDQPNNQTPDNQTPNNQTPNNQTPNTKHQTTKHQTTKHQTPNNQTPNTKHQTTKQPNTKQPQLPNIKTHFSVASPLSGLAGTGLMVCNLARPHEVLLCFIMAIIGGVLPDIDSNKSVTLRLLFSLLAPVAAFLAVFAQKPGFSMIGLSLIWVATFLAVRYPVCYFFIRFTTHRGLIHSIPAGGVFGLGTTILLYRVFHFSDTASWMAGSFLFLGFLIHLILDELNSINWSEKRLKKSYGTAFKLGKSNDPGGTAALYITLVALFFLAPDPRSFLSLMSCGL